MKWKYTQLLWCGMKDLQLYIFGHADWIISKFTQRLFVASHSSVISIHFITMSKPSLLFMYFDPISIPIERKQFQASLFYCLNL